MSRRFELSMVEFEMCWEMVGLGAPPLSSGTPPDAAGRAEDPRHDQLVRSQLRGKGLTDRRGVHPDLTALLRLLTGYSWAVEASLAMDRPVRAIGAATGEHGVVAILTEGQVHIRACHAGSVVSRLVRLIGATPGPGSPVTVRAERLDGAARSVDGDMSRLADALIERGTAPRIARAMQRMCSGHEWLGQLAVVVRDGLGGYLPGERVIGLHATGEGWYAQLRLFDPSGAVVTVAPADPDLVAVELGTLLDETRQLAAT